MSTAHLYFPAPLFAQRGRTLGSRGVAGLSLAVALCCAAIVFVLLYNFDQRYPVAAVHNHRTSAPLPLSAAVTRQALPQIESHRAAATSISSEIQGPGPIARTHNELLALERLGNRNYVEFSLARSGSFQLVGPVEIRFSRADSRHASIQVSVLLHERRIDFKNLKVDQHIFLPTAGSQPLDLVINRATRNQITGYLSEPKNGD